jgi:PLP dependent protein
MNIEKNLETIKNRITRVLENSRLKTSVTVLAVTKTATVEQIKEVLQAGLKDIGESRIQDAVRKFEALGAPAGVKRHFIGHLQSNKAKKALELFDLIQSVDSIELAGEIDRQAQKLNKIQDCLVELKLSPEQTKFGLSPASIFDFMEKALLLKNIAFRGLMTIAPYFPNPGDCRPFFREAREIFEKLKVSAGKPGFDILSMGMSGDFEVAIQEGSTMVRIGTAIFK